MLKLFIDPLPKDKTEILWGFIPLLKVCTESLHEDKTKNCQGFTHLLLFAPWADKILQQSQ